MATPSSRSSSLTPCRSPTPEPPIIQPDHFYGSEGIQFPPSPNSDGKTWLDPNDDPTASRGIPVFKPTMEHFQDFEGYMEKINCWGQRSGIVKVIPPKEWTGSLPSIKPQLKEVKIKTPIEQHMLGSGGLFRQQNMEKRKVMSVREWVELCNKDEYRAPAVHEVGLEGRNQYPRVVQPRTRKGKKIVKDEPEEDDAVLSPAPSPPAESSKKPKKAPVRRIAQSREVRQANLAERAARDLEFLDTFEPEQDWLPHNTQASDYTPEFCQKLERHYWRNCGLGKSAWYGADTQGTLYTDETKVWNVGHLPSALNRLLPASDKGLPGVNTPYLYFGMWRATFAWHVEDMDLYSINYIHFGAPKFWYAVPQAKAPALEQAMRAYFPKDTSQCHQFLRHKSFLVSPTTLAKTSCRPNHLVQHANEFVITYPRGYHAGFNLGLNCAESVNFALECWIELGRVAKTCKCVPDSVTINVDQLLRDRAEEAQEEEEQAVAIPGPPKPKRSHKKKPVEPIILPVKKEITDRVIPLLKISRKRAIEEHEELPKLKKIKLRPSPQKSTTAFVLPVASASASSLKPPLPKISITLKLGPRPVEAEPYPCCLCISMSKVGLLPVHEPPLNRKDAVDAANSPKVWMAHELCASIIPETWVDSFETVSGSKVQMVFGVGAIVKDRWNLKCSACSRARPKAHGAPVQCTKGKCPKAFHVTCAQDVQAHGTLFTILREVEKEVVLFGPPPPIPMQVDPNPYGPLAQTAEERVLKVIKKLDVQILCSQHNPAIAAQKKASKQEKIRLELLALPTMSRIKIRVSSGVFEVSLLRVIEENSSVEVLWDRATKREFKWGSVVFGSTDGPVLQKPIDGSPLPLLQPERSVSVAESAITGAIPVPIYPSVTAATTAEISNKMNSMVAPVVTASSSSSSSSSSAPSTSTSTNSGYAYTAQRGAAAYEYWPYATQQVPYSAYPQGTYATYPYSGYYSGATAYSNNSTPTYNVYPYGQGGAGTGGVGGAGGGGGAVSGFPPNASTQYRNGGLQWQRPYQGPVPGASATTIVIGAPATTANQVLSSSTSISTTPIAYQASRPPSLAQSHALSSEVQTGAAYATVPVGQVQVDGSAEQQVGGGDDSSATSDGVSGGPTSDYRHQQEQEQEQEQSSLPTLDLSTLAQLPAQELTELLSQDPQLREVVLAALNQSAALQQQLGEPGDGYSMA